MQTAQATLSHKDFLRIDKNYQHAATVANLRYVSDQIAGIERIKKGNGFSYRHRGKTITDEKILTRIKKLVIPPAWTRVWICPTGEGHIQATGYDVRGRKQYRYHPRWNALQHETKFHRMIEFGKVLPKLRERLKKDLSQTGFPETKVLAMVLAVMETTYIRIGNEGYEKLYGSYGLTTLKNNHVNVKGDEVTFSFKGKKGVYHKVSLKNKKLARILKECKAIPGKELFQYFDEEGNVHKVDSGQVNQYLKESLEMEFTTKDFRTWAGTLSMLAELKKCTPCAEKGDYQKNIITCLQNVSKKLGNTVAVCRKYYVHPELVRMYKDDELTEFLGLKKVSNDDKEYGLNDDEEILMKILKRIERAKVQLTAA